MKAYVGMKGMATLISYISIRWMRVVNFVPWPLPHGERTPGTHWIKGQVGRRAGLDVMETGKIFCICRVPPTHHPAHSLLDILIMISLLLSYMVQQSVSLVVTNTRQKVATVKDNTRYVWGSTAVSTTASEVHNKPSAVPLGAHCDSVKFRILICI
jgi:hypothetical protein